MVQEKLKKKYLSNFDIVLFHRISLFNVLIGKNTKNSKQYASFETAIHKCMGKILEIMLIWYFNLNEKLVT